MEPNIGVEQLAAIGVQEVSGQAIQITIKPSGKLYFERVNPQTIQDAEDRGWDCKIVHYCGFCPAEKINEFVHSGLSVIIDGVSTDEFKSLVASPGECYDIYK